ncbi:hypothetical protein G7Y79_00036g071840 [Physcia stellaris]|nr:hypothetical protein G7Y79_00036g071840 [Physcia stellaris]
MTSIYQPKSSLETLPYELKLVVLKTLPNLSTLHSFINASLTYNAIYLSASSKILIHHPFNAISAHPRRHDLLRKPNSREITHRACKHAPSFNAAFDSYYAQLEAGIPPARMRLGVRHCDALLTLLSDHVGIYHGVIESGMERDMRVYCVAGWCRHTCIAETNWSRVEPEGSKGWVAGSRCVPYGWLCDICRH